MNWNEIQGNWHLFKGRIKEKWGELTDDDIAQLNGEFEQFVGLLQKKLGVEREMAEFQIGEFQKSVADPANDSRESFVSRIEDGLRETGTKLAHLKDKASAATGEAKQKLDAEVARLSEQYKGSKAKLADVKGASGDAWKDLSAGCSESWNRFKHSCESAWSRFSA